MSGHATTGVNMFPGRGQRPRPLKKQKRKYIGFRPKPHLAAYIETAEELGYGVTEIVEKLAENMMDASQVLGADWYDLERLAHLAGKSPGTLMGEMVKSELKKGSK